MNDGGAATAHRFTFGTGSTGLPHEAYFAGWVVVGALLRAGVPLHSIATTPSSQLPQLILDGISHIEREAHSTARGMAA